MQGRGGFRRLILLLKKRFSFWSLHVCAITVVQLVSPAQGMIQVKSESTAATPALCSAWSVDFFLPQNACPLHENPVDSLEKIFEMELAGQRLAKASVLKALSKDVREYEESLGKALTIKDYVLGFPYALQQAYEKYGVEEFPGTTHDLCCHSCVLESTSDTGH